MDENDAAGGGKGRVQEMLDAALATATAPGIDPVPILGDVLNHFEAMIQAHGELTMHVMGLIEKNGLETPEMKAAAQKMIATYQAYWSFKATVFKPADKGEEVGDGK